jgi:hypothetical protein
MKDKFIFFKKEVQLIIIKPLHIVFQLMQSKKEIKGKGKD